MSTRYSNVTLYGVSQDDIVQYLFTIGHDAYVSPTINNCTTIYDSAAEQPFATEGTYQIYETAFSQYPASMLEQIKLAFSEANSQVSAVPNKQAISILERYGSTYEASLVSLVSQLSIHFSCPALAVFLRSDTDFWYHLNQEGKMIDEYTTYAEDNWQPGMGISSLAGQIIKGGDAQKICAAFKKEEAIEEVTNILQKSDAPIDFSLIPFDLNYSALLQLPSFPNAVIRHRALSVALGIQPCWTTYMSYANVRQKLLDHFIGDPEAPSKEEALNLLRAVSSRQK